MSETNSEGGITVEVKDRILLMGINRPQKMNGFTPLMMNELSDAYTRLENDSALWCGVLFAHGDHFTAGLDLPKFQDKMRKGEQARTKEKIDPTSLIARCSKPIVTAVKGVTFTLGIELMLAGDIVIAADNCRFSQLEPLRGIHATGGATIRFVQRCGWGNAMYHLLTSDEFNSKEAFRIGLVQEVVTLGSEFDRAVEIAKIICEGAPLAVQATKRSSMRYLLEGEEKTIKAFAEDQARLAETADAEEGIRSFEERRKGNFSGC